MSRLSAGEQLFVGCCIWFVVVCALVVVVLVGAAGYRLRSATGAKAAIILAGIAATLVVLAFFVVDTFRNAPQTFTAIVVIAALAVGLDVVWKRVRGEPPASTPLAPVSQE